jgi:hypothetical protein
MVEPNFPYSMIDLLGIHDHDSSIVIATAASPLLLAVTASAAIHDFGATPPWIAAALRASQ